MVSIIQKEINGWIVRPIGNLSDGNFWRFEAVKGDYAESFTTMTAAVYFAENNP